MPTLSKFRSYKGFRPYSLISKETIQKIQSLGFSVILKEETHSTLFLLEEEDKQALLQYLEKRKEEFDPAIYVYKDQVILSDGDVDEYYCDYGGASILVHELVFSCVDFQSPLLYIDTDCMEKVEVMFRNHMDDWEFDMMKDILQHAGISIISKTEKEKSIELERKLREIFFNFPRPTLDKGIQQALEGENM